ncbi:hypothetical protein DFJ74DRAFT_702217 [Hyaloraphidium curvatum]|nr:hypothetical protein DFJ74DRAFT_702217 [Hyaloraphidium curvatum]
MEPPGGVPPASAADIEAFRAAFRAKLERDGFSAPAAAAAADSAARFLAAPRPPPPHVRLFRPPAGDVCFSATMEIGAALRVEQTCFLRRPDALRERPPGAAPPLLPFRAAVTQRSAVDAMVGQAWGMREPPGTPAEGAECLDITEDTIVVRFRTLVPKHAPQTITAPAPPTKLQQSAPGDDFLPGAVSDLRAFAEKHAAPALRFAERFRASWDSGRAAALLKRIAEDGFGIRGEGWPDGGKAAEMVKRGGELWKRWLGEVWDDVRGLSRTWARWDKSARETGKKGEGQ